MSVNVALMTFHGVLCCVNDFYQGFVCVNAVLMTFAAFCVALMTLSRINGPLMTLRRINNPAHDFCTGLTHAHVYYFACACLLHCMRMFTTLHAHVY